MIYPRRQCGGACGQMVVPDRLSVFELTAHMVDAFDTEQRIAEDEMLQSMGFGRLLWVSS